MHLQVVATAAAVRDVTNVNQKGRWGNQKCTMMKGMRMKTGLCLDNISSLDSHSTPCKVV